MDLDDRGDNGSSDEEEEEELLAVLCVIMNTIVMFLTIVSAYFIHTQLQIPNDVPRMRKRYSLTSSRQVIGISDQECNETNNGSSETDGKDSENDNFSSPTHVVGSTSGQKKKGKKRHISDTTGEQLVNLMGKFCKQTNENLQLISERVGYKMLMSEKREKLYEALGKLGVLSAEERIRTARLLVNNDKNLELFFSLPEDARARMVTLMAAGRI